MLSSANSSTKARPARIAVPVAMSPLPLPHSYHHEAHEESRRRNDQPMKQMYQICLYSNQTTILSTSVTSVKSVDNNFVQLRDLRGEKDRGLLENLLEFISHDFHVFVRDKNRVSAAFHAGDCGIEVVRCECAAFATMTVGDQRHECRHDAPEMLVTAVDHPKQLTQCQRSRINRETACDSPNVLPAVGFYASRSFCRSASTFCIVFSTTSSTLIPSTFVSAALTLAIISFFCFCTVIARSLRPRLWKKSMSSS